MDNKALTTEAIRELLCTNDKQKTLDKISESLEEAWDMEAAERLVVDIGEDMNKQLKANGLTWTPAERFLWAVKEAFILGSLDMIQKIMVTIDMMKSLAEDAPADEGAHDEV